MKTSQCLDKPQTCNRDSRTAFSPFTPMKHCPQCDGTIDPRCVRTTPGRSDREYPRRRVEAFCDFCTVGFSALYELHGPDEWSLIDNVRILRGDQVRNLRTFAESQMSVIRMK